MTNVKLLFYGTNLCDDSSSELEVNATIDNEIKIQIKEDNFPYRFIFLDKSTAIKFSRELRKQIALL